MRTSPRSIRRSAALLVTGALIAGTLVACSDADNAAPTGIDQSVVQDSATQTVATRTVATQESATRDSTIQESTVQDSGTQGSVTQESTPQESASRASSAAPSADASPSTRARSTTPAGDSAANSGSASTGASVDPASSRRSVSTARANPTSGPATSKRARPATPVTAWALSEPGELGPAWQQEFLAEYGTRDRQLGVTDPPVVIGPEYAAPAPDGSWWVLDAAKKRVVHLDADGAFVDAVPVAADLLAEGSYFQFQLPRVLADGTVIAVQQTEGPADLLVVADGKAVVRRTSRSFVPVGDDGALLYGFAGSTPVSVDPSTGVVTDVEYFSSRGGDRYLVTTADDRVRITLPDTEIGTVTVPVTGPGGAAVDPHLEIAVGDDGTIHLLLTALDPASGRPLSGYAEVGPDGTVYPVEPLRALDSPVDPGTAAHLVTRPGTATAFLVFVDVEGMRVFARR